MAEPTPDELLEQIRKLQVKDVLLSSFSTVAQLAYAKLDSSARDLEQAKLAIESLRALVPVLDGAVEPDTLRDFKQVVANLQLAYTDAAAAESPVRESGPGEGARGDREVPPTDVEDAESEPPNS